MAIHSQWSSGQDSTLPLQGVWVGSLVRELKILHAMWCSQKIFIYIYKNIYIYLRNTYFASGTISKTLEIATNSIIMKTL